MRRVALCLAASAALGLALLQTASAADLLTKAPVYKAPPPMIVYNWTGCYVGVEGGWAGGRSQHFAETGGTTFPATN